MLLLICSRPGLDCYRLSFRNCGKHSARESRADIVRFIGLGAKSPTAAFLSLLFCSLHRPDVFVNLLCL